MGNSWERVILDLRLLLEYALRGDAHVVVVGERRADEILQLGLAKDLGPVLIAERGLVGGGDLGVIGSAEGGRSGHLRTLVVGADGAAGQKKQEQSAEGEPARREQGDGAMRFMRRLLLPRQPQVRPSASHGPWVESIVVPLPPRAKRWERYSTTEKVVGIMRMPMTVASAMPPITTVPRMRREAAPAPLAVQSGMQPTMKASAVMTMGRKRRRAALQRGVSRCFARCGSSAPQIRR